MSEASPAPVAGRGGRTDRERVAEKAITPAGGGVLERVLASLLDLSFVLTDRDGFVTRWTPRAERLFGLDGAGAAGRPLLESLGASEAEAPAAGRVQIEAHHQDGQPVKVELTFIPVPMSHSLEFNGFLESLESDRPTESVLKRVNSQHSDVLDWIGSVVTDGVPLHSDELTAGTIVAFRPVGEVPWLEEPEAAAPAPSAGGKSDPGLADAVDRAADVLARSDALERTLDEAGETVEEARATADAAREEAAGATQRVSELADENASLRLEFERAQSDLAELKTRLDSASSPVTGDALKSLRAELETIRSTPPGVEKKELNTLREEIDGLRGSLQAERAAATEREEALRTELREMRGATDGGGEAAGAAAQRAEAAAEAVQALADELRAELKGARDAASEAREAADAAVVEAKVARVQAEAARVHSEEADGHAKAAREVAEAWASAAEKHRAPRENGRSPAPKPTAAKRTAAKRPEKKPEPPPREPRPGFDDVASPMATIGLDGRFRELNSSFSELVGYNERDFHSASWPPVADRAQLDNHREQMRAMIAGEVDSVEVNTGYVHAQGLLVPVAGTLSVARDDDGEASHFLLAVRSPVAAAAS